MSVSFKIEGLEELRQQLQKLPAVLADKAQQRIVSAAQLANSRIRNGYPVRTGNLRNHVYVSVRRTGVAVVATVKNTAKHAYIFENGTQARHTDLGASRGSMPPGHVFIPVVAQERRAMYEDLKEIISEEGLEVSGDA